MNPGEISSLLTGRTPIRTLGYNLPASIGKMPSQGESISFENLIYHYTSMESFKKILQSKCLWASEYRKLNDSSEIHFAINLVLDLIQRREWKNVEKSVAQTFFIDVILPLLKDDIYILSMSMKSSVLSQWRGYAMPDGVCFGIPLDLLNELVKKQNCICAPVIYDTELQKLILEPLLASMEFLSKANDNQIDSFTSEFLRNFRQFSPFIKHQAFHEEAEFRICILPEMEVNTKIYQPAGLGKSIAEFQLETKLCGNKSSMIRSVIVGPCDDYWVKMECLKKLLNELNYDWGMISFCEIPFSG